MPKTTEKKQMTSYNFGVTTYLTFKYEAKRNSDPTKVDFKIEPRIQYSGSTTSNAAAVFFNSNYPKTSSKDTVTSFTHSCACNKTYSNKSGGSYKYNWYGGTGTSTASSDNDYPVNGDSWVYGNWSSITVPVDVTATSVTLYFNFANEYGYGSYENDGKGTTIWNAYAKKYRFGVTFEVPVGYTNNGNPGKPTCTTDIGKMSSIDVASSYFTAKWTAPSKIGTNNSVKHYRVHVGIWGTIDSTTEKRKEYLYADNVTTTSLKITKSNLVDLVGIPPNTKVTKGDSKYWKRTDVRIEAVNKYGGNTYSSVGSQQIYWNEKPSAPTATTIKHGSNVSWTNNEVGMNDYFNTRIEASGSIDKWLPGMPSTFTAASTQSVQSYKYLITRTTTTPSESTFTSKGILRSAGTVLWLNDADALGNNPELGTGPYYIHVRGWDGLQYSSATRQPFFLGRNLNADGNVIIRKRDGSVFSELSADMEIVIPAVHVDGSDSDRNKTLRYPSSSSTMQVAIYAQKRLSTNESWSSKYRIYETSINALQNGETYIVSFDKFWNTMLDTLAIDISGATTQPTQIQFHVKLTCEKERRLTTELATTWSSNHIVRSANASGGLIGSDGSSVLWYSYGQVTPYITSNVIAQFEISGLPKDSLLAYYIEYAALGSSDSPMDSSVIWYRYTSGKTGNTTEPITCTMNMSTMTSRMKGEALKCRLRLMDASGNTNYVGLYWPGYNNATSDSQRMQYASILGYKLPNISVPTVLSGESSIANGDKKNKNHVNFNFNVYSPSIETTRVYEISLTQVFRVVDGLPRYICGSGNINKPCLTARYFSSPDPTNPYKAPYFEGEINFGEVTELDGFLFTDAILTCDKNSFISDQSNINVVPGFGVNQKFLIYVGVSCAEILKLQPGWTNPSSDPNNERKILFTTFTPVFPISSYSNAKYEKLAMSGSVITRKNGGKLV